MDVCRVFCLCFNVSNHAVKGNFRCIDRLLKTIPHRRYKYNWVGNGPESVLWPVIDGTLPVQELICVSIRDYVVDSYALE